MTVVYSFFNGEDGEYFATKSEAMRAAKEFWEWQREHWDSHFPIEVRRYVIIGGRARDVAVALLSGRGWCAKSETVAVFGGAP